jgi:archaellin
VNATTIGAGPPEVVTAGTIQFTVANTAGGDPIPLDPAATNNRTVIAYRDAAGIDNDVGYTVTWIVDDADDLLESGELAVVVIDVAADIDLDDVTAGVQAPSLNANERWTLEIQTPVGAVLDLTRSLPADLEAVMQLH